MHICKNDETRSANLIELQRFEEVRIPPPLLVSRKGSRFVVTRVSIINETDSKLELSENSPKTHLGIVRVATFRPVSSIIT